MFVLLESKKWENVGTLNFVFLFFVFFFLLYLGTQNLEILVNKNDD